MITPQKLVPVFFLALASSLPSLPESVATQEVTGAEEVPVFFTNHAYFDVQVYAVQAAVDNVPMGLVRAFSTVRRWLAPQIVASGREVQFLLVPANGSESHTTDAIIVTYGDAVTVTIENDLDLSMVSVQPRD